MKQALIFDLDGTLLDSMHVWRDVGDLFLKERGVSHIPSELSDTLKKMSIRESATYLCRRFGFEESAEELTAALNAQMEYQYRNVIGLKPGALAFLQQNSHRPMCLATATRRSLVEPALERLCIAPFFRFILTSDEVGCSKLEPDIFLQAAEGLGAKVADCAVFEDALHAAQSAKSAGFYVVGVQDESAAKDEEAMRALCDEFVPSLTACTV